jgi:hypothetical protein
MDERSHKSTIRLTIKSRIDIFKTRYSFNVIVYTSSRRRHEEIVAAQEKLVAAEKE